MTSIKKKGSAPQALDHVQLVLKLRNEAVALARQPSINFYELAQLIATLRELDGSALINIPGQAALSRRKLYYLLAVGRLIADTGLSKADAETVGWTKLQIIARHVATAGPAGSELLGYLALARNTKARSLWAALRGGRIAATRAVQFNLGTGARAELNEALLAFGAEGGPKRMFKKDRALIKIVRAAMASRGLAYEKIG